MAGQVIADRIAVERRYVRAVDIARDLPDPAALGGYVLTSRAKEALGRLASGIAPTSTQRAFRITGPYGSGKSSFGLLLAKLVAGGSREATAIAGKALGDASFPALEPLVLVGRRTSLARELLAALSARASAAFGERDALATRCTLLLANSADSRIETRDVLDLLAELAARLHATNGRGLLVLIDEMGRFLEFVAANQGEEDPALFQQLAERAGGSANPHLAVVAFLHHRFDDYLAANDVWSGKEWARSAERYEEIAFSEPREQSIHLLSNALVPLEPHFKPVQKMARALYDEAADRALFALPALELRQLAQSLYPLHPASLACLTSAASRFGQHDRSVFSFLQSSEPSGYRHFAHTKPYDAAIWYLLDDVYDYLASLGGLRFDSADRDRRWSLGQEAVDALQDDDTARRILKAVAVVATLEPVPGLKADASALAWSLGLGQEEVQRVLDGLVTDRVLYRRAASKDYSLWSNSSVDLGHWYAEAERAVAKPARLDGELAEIPALRPVIAQRHYHDTGTMRSFLVHFGGEQRLPDGVDGEIVVLPVHGSDDAKKMMRKAIELSDELGPLAIVHLRRISEEDMALSYQLSRWKWVAESCSELRMDDLARSEVRRNIAAIEQRLQARLAPLAFREGQHDWFYRGKRETIENRAALSRRLSEICSEVFCKAPILRNELVNRGKLSSAIAAARMRLLGRMIDCEHEEFLGLTGAPPERTIHLSLFHASTMHREEDGEFGFHPPLEDNPLGWKRAWDHVDELVKADEAVSFETLIEQLGERPYGLRAGPALLLIAAVMLHYRTTISLVERGTFQPELTEAHFMRLAKNPRHFALKRLSAESDGAMLERLSSSLAIFDGKRPAAELKPIVEALFLWWRDLDDFARTTRQVDAITRSVRASLRKAKDPIQLLLVTLPRDCDALDKHGIDAERYVETLDGALQQLDEALPQLRLQVAARLTGAFGTRSIADLRQQVRLDYQDHILQLGDYKLRAFVDRAMNEDLSEELWLDRVASLLVGKRLEAWDDSLLDQFGFEVRRMAQELARRLAVLREARAQSAPVTAVHITTSGGEDRSFYLHNGQVRDRRTAAKLREALAGHERPEALLIEALQEILQEREEERAK